LLLVFVLGTFLTRSAGCVVNDIADRKFDPFVERTQDRPLAQGVITVRAALLWMGVLLGLAAILVLTTNVLTIMLAAVGACFAGLYPFMKRITHLPQLVLGLAFSMGIPMAFTAVTGALSEAAGLLFLANLVWVVAYDTEYAMVDRAEDLLIGVKSTAILFGDLDRFIIGVLQALFVLLLWQVGGHLDFSAVYQGLLAVIAGLLCYQQFLIRDQSREGSFAAFKNNQWVGGTFFLAVLIECEAML
jgi:4-hydroxybenzoate polyprenyltransferase